ncbi:transcriptional regulator [Halopseudomonas phragmitis]|uniref:Transcriptional regulator n=1 Tax=Halopseudomonas phragmitis TaxID=1931241 RepID=A0A1V0B3X8_9GAMM|nr:transcriptional regulator [Halopseudomonas phragmitis]AQZ94600.1 transcriptional regulator [Halopseudomonas phragmitis]PAU88333.1 transcriptional regulator [Pseudomonas sp. WN033]
MKFSVLVAMLAEDLEEQAIASAKAAGAGGVTLLNGRGLGAEQKKSFFGLTYEGSQSVMIFVLEKKLSLRVMKQLVKDLDLKNHTRGVVFTLPIEHIAGIAHQQIEHFEQLIKNEI